MFVLSFKLYVMEFSSQAYIIQFMDSRRSEVLSVFMKEETLYVRYRQGR